MQEGAEWSFETDDELNLFIYIVEGEGYFGDSNELIESKRALLFDKGDIF
jgi:redox-sensitive bicupin YhaK (pirin superfamily)